MRIIIVGCGKIGRKLVAELSEENHDITIIDINQQIVEATAIKYDVMGIEGNGTSYKVLESADIEHADILIAVTHSDEVNLLCCLIAKNPRCMTIARVRNPIYLAEQEKFRQQLGISVIINSERAAAVEIKRLLQYPSAIDINSFSRGSIDMLTFKVKEGSFFDGRKLSEATELQKYQILVCVVERGNEIVIPNGDYVIMKGDKISFISRSGEAGKIFKAIGVYSDSAKSVLIIGCGQLGYYTAEKLIEAGVYVKIIESDRKRCEEIAELLPKATVVCGDGSDQNILAEEHLENMEAVVASTNMDEENIILSLYAKGKVKKKIITKISHLGFSEVIGSLDLDSVINPKDITAEYILKYVRERSNKKKGSNIQTLYRLKENRVEAIEFLVSGDSELIGPTFSMLNFKPNVLVAAIIRGGELIIPGGSDSFMEGDSVIVATTNKGYQSLEDIVERQAVH
ncbi:MAG TPA: Trk system potassium transporter TrkA [Candidatus Alectryocaccobium stercorigallinarum]|nr:Trk system potassium transporter TrkA [Candidatus Alectryocaccobium stercorigallinarum]